MNQIHPDRRDAAIKLMVEGCSLASITRITRIAKTTLIRLIRELGLLSFAYHEAFAKSLPCGTLQVDETWSFVAMKRKNVPEEKRGAFGNGDVWNWTALDAESRFLVCWLFADHSSESAQDFMREIKTRIAGDFTISADGLHSYPYAINRAFGPYAMRPVDPTGSSTNRMERWNLTLRMGNRRFTRSTNAFSKSLENHFYAMAIFAFHYNFVRHNSAVAGTPAMAIGLIGRALTFDDLYTLAAFGGLDLDAARKACDRSLKIETAKILQWGASSKVREYVLIRPEAATA